VLLIEDDARVRTITLNRPEALNAFNSGLYRATTEALREAAVDRSVAVVVLTGAGRAFSAGNDLREMAEDVGHSGSTSAGGDHPFGAMVEALADFPKPLVAAVNGVALGIGVTLLGYADLVFMSTDARLKCPFTDLGLAPEAASSYLLPQLIGRQNAAWLLMSSQWIDAEQAQRMGIAWQVCAPEELMRTARTRAEVLAAKPISSLMAIKRTMVEPVRSEIAAALRREGECFAELMGSPANLEALAAFAQGRPPDFTNLG